MRQSVVFTVAPPLSKRERETRRVSGNTSSIDARPSIDVTTYNLNLDPGLHPYWTITTAMEELHHDDRTAECQLPPSGAPRGQGQQHPYFTNRAKTKQGRAATPAVAAA